MSVLLVVEGTLVNLHDVGVVCVFVRVLCTIVYGDDDDDVVVFGIDNDEAMQDRQTDSV